MKLQTVIVKKSAAPTRAKATQMARKHADRIYTSRETSTSWRFRQRPPSCFRRGFYKTKCIRNGKVCLVYAPIKDPKRKACR